MDHCIAKIQEIVAQSVPSSRTICQLGYNLGRLSELTGLGREPFWDRWKFAIDRWDLPTLKQLAQDLPIVCQHISDPSPTKTPESA